MKAWAYYNEFEPYCVAWLRSLIKEGLIPDGEVDDRSIVNVSPDDLRGFVSCHFFAGLGGWPYALRLAGWPDDRGVVWTGSCPCQPFSNAGRGAGEADARHLWPVLSRLIGECRPDAFFGEQVAAAVGKNWLDGVCADLEGFSYACGPVAAPACAVNAPHRRDRLWFVGRHDGNVADDNGCGPSARSPASEAVGYGNAASAGDSVVSMADARSRRFGGPGQGEAQQPGRAEVERAGDCAVAHADSGGETGRGLQRPGESHGQNIERAYGQLGGPGGGAMGDACASGLSVSQFPALDGARRKLAGRAATESGRAPWASARWLIGADGKARRVGSRVRLVADGLSAGVAGVCAGQESDAEMEGEGEAEEMIPLLAAGVPARVGKLKALGNAIVPQLAAEFVAAFLEAEAEGFEQREAA